MVALAPSSVASVTRRRFPYSLARLAILPILAAGMVTRAGSQFPPAAISQGPVYREPFTLKLLFNSDEYRKRFERVPYVVDDAVYLFPGEHFGIRVKVTDEEISEVTYEPDAAKADIEFTFTTQNKMMLLIIRNRMSRTLYMKAGMRVPDRGQLVRTRITPVQPTLPNFEYWPHPVLQLALRNLRFRQRASD